MIFYPIAHFLYKASVAAIRAAHSSWRTRTHVYTHLWYIFMHIVHMRTSGAHTFFSFIHSHHRSTVRDSLPIHDDMCGGCQRVCVCVCVRVRVVLCWVCASSRRDRWWRRRRREVFVCPQHKEGFHQCCAFEHYAKKSVTMFCSYCRLRFFWFVNSCVRF